MNEDTVFIEQFCNGDEKGFEALVRKYQNRVLNIIYSIIGPDRENDDIMQEVFMKVYRGVGSFKHKSRFSTWLYRIVVNTTYDFLRKRKEFITDEGILEQAPSASPGPREAVLIKEKEDLIRQALRNVPLQFRTAVVLKDIEGLSYAEIAQVLQCSIGTVESRIYRARQSLKEELEKAGGNLV